MFFTDDEYEKPVDLFDKFMFDFCAIAKENDPELNLTYIEEDYEGKDLKEIESLSLRPGFIKSIEFRSNRTDMMVSVQVFEKEDNNK